MLSDEEQAAISRLARAIIEVGYPSADGYVFIEQWMKEWDNHSYSFGWEHQDQSMPDSFRRSNVFFEHLETLTLREVATRLSDHFVRILDALSSRICYYTEALEGYETPI